MAQIFLPAADVAAGRWTTSPLWSKIDDDLGANPTGDGVTILSADNAPPDDYDFAFTAGSDPASSTGHILRARWNKDAAGGHSIDAVLELWQGTPGTGTLIATLSVTAISETEQTSEYTLSAGEADSITDYAALHGRLSRQGDTGGPQSGRRSLVVEAAELETPDAASGVTATQNAAYESLELPSSNPSQPWEASAAALAGHIGAYESSSSPQLAEPQPWEGLTETLKAAGSEWEAAGVSKTTHAASWEA
ncbi:MAG TPA: hypothetical protein VLV83_08830, partial [Acidobacteriota bacterium]|nr:hypothetical protein [Acidobacteriota bacterium]